MEILRYNNTHSLNNRYGTIKRYEIDTVDYYNNVDKILNGTSTINSSYVELYDNYMHNNIDIQVFVHKFYELIQEKFKNNILSIPNLIFSVNEFITNLIPFVSFFDFKKMTLQGKTVSYHIHHICADEIYNKIMIKYIDIYVDQLINCNNKIIELTKVFGKFFTNGLGYYKEYIDDLTNVNKYDFTILNSFYYTISSKINDILQNHYNSKHDIQYILDKINAISSFLNTNFLNDDTHTFLKLCYPLWSTQLLDEMTLDNQMIPMIIGQLQLMEPYVGTYKLASNIGIKVRHLIEHKLAPFKPYDNYVKQNLTDDKLYNKLLEISVLCEIIFNGWQKYKSLYDQLIELCNDIFSSNVIDYFYLYVRKCIIKNVCEESYDEILVNNITRSQKNMMAGITLTMRTKEIDRCITNYMYHLQKRYIGTDYNITKMIKFDELVYGIAEEFISKNPQLKNHTSDTMNKFKTIINDIKVSVQINNELKSIKIKYIDIDDNEVQKPTYEPNNINYLMTTNTNSWVDISKQIANNYDINYNENLKYIYCTFNGYYKEKCPQRITKMLNDCSTLHIDYQLNGTIYKLNVTMMQTNVLMLFQNTNSFDLESINKAIAKNPTELTQQHLKNVCDSLVSAKLLNVCNDVYSLNDKMKMPKKYTEEPANIIKFYLKQSEPVKSVQQQNDEIIEYDRNNTLKCYVIKCVKSNKQNTFSETEIFDYVEKNLKLFVVNLDDIQKCIAILLKTYYIDEIKGEYKYADE